MWGPTEDAAARASTNAARAEDCNTRRTHHHLTGDGRRALGQAALFALSALFWACAESAAGTPSIAYQAELGTWDYALGEFTPLDGEPTLPLIVGFQGLRFASLAVATSADVPQQQSATIFVELPDLGDTYDFVDNQLYFESEILPDGTSLLVIPSFRIPFEWDPEELEGTHVRVTAELTSRDGHIASVEGRFTLTGEDGCTHSPDGTILCE